MSNILHIEGDPTPWALAEDAPTVPTWIHASEPVALEVASPLRGTLILSPRRAESVAVIPPDLDDQGDWPPCAQVTAPRLYLPSPAGAPKTSPGYELAPPDTRLGLLQERILVSMEAGTIITVSVTAGRGVVFVNGAFLPFAIICQPG